MRSKLVIGILAGITGSFSTLILDFIVHKLGKTHLEILFVNRETHLPKIITKIVPDNIYIFLIHLSIGGVLGSVFVYLLLTNRSKNLIYNGFLLSGFAWFIHGNILGNMLRLPIKETIMDNIIFAIANLIFGFGTVLSGYFITKYIS